MLTRSTIRIFRSALFFSLTILLASCGGSGGSSKPSVSPTPTSSIPTTLAIQSVTAPQAQSPQTSQPLNIAKLTHVYKSSVLDGDADNLVHSPNADVEQLSSFGLYTEVERNSDNTYDITLEENGLAYFRVINTKPNGSERVHLFYGVPAGEYLTLDSTGLDSAAQEVDSGCRDISIRLTDLSPALTARLLVNGHDRELTIDEGDIGWYETINVCPIGLDDYYLVAVVEEVGSDIHYGFDFYQGLNQGDVIEISIEHDARMVPWSSNIAVSTYYSLHAQNDSWQTSVELYSPAKIYDDDNEITATEMSGMLPLFDEISLQRYAWYGISNISHRREFLPQADDVNFQLLQIDISDVTLDPLTISWQSNGQDQPNVLAGLIFDSGLTQTYAFMTMDPDVLADGKLDLPYQDLELLLDSAFVGLSVAAAPEGSSNNYIGTAAVLSGFVASANENGNELDNADTTLTGNTSEVLELFLQLLDD